MFFHHFLIVKSFQPWRFSLLSCILAILATFHLFYILKIFLFRFGYFWSFSFQFTSLFHPNFGFGLKDLNFGSEVVLYISFSLLHFFYSFSLIFPDEKHYFTSFFHLSMGAIPVLEMVFPKYSICFWPNSHLLMLSLRPALFSC